MGYSIPSSEAEKILSSLSTLTTREKVPEAEQGVLGVQVKDIDAQTAESFAMPKGIYIYKILKDTGAKNEALQERDIITKLDGQGVYTTANLKALLAKYRAGEEVKLTVMRQDGSGKYNEVELSVTLGKASALQSGNGSKGTNPYSGGESNAPDSSDGESGGNGDNGSVGNDGNNQQNEDNGNSGSDRDSSENDPFKSFQDFFNEYRR